MALSLDSSNSSRYFVKHMQHMSTLSLSLFLYLSTRPILSTIKFPLILRRTFTIAKSTPILWEQSNGRLKCHFTQMSQPEGVVSALVHIVGRSSSYAVL